ncbi:hypothetical protein O7634_13315 [Micromonospora sp. WMMD1120]|uniref:hypothetical protein n=1 Tax=Micromonospora sp. WMMD1120 TaxID=3016106 RepID=UPI0024171C3A|nr:hypothetical protein [Micromonospora sp. WMMD1120]MDG4807731.1 hypothetical protein [Micromonospora sp. WMMD1120]
MNKTAVLALVTLGAAAAVAVPVALYAGPADAAEEPPSLVEDFSYPGAAAIKQSRDIELIKGDGRITLVDCTDNPELIRVESLLRTDFCFSVKGDSGWLSLRLDGVFLIHSGDQKVAAKVAANGVEETVNIRENSIQQVGIGDPDFGVLLELRATPPA